MAIRVTRRARRHADRAGDPLDGLVNLFDLGIVLAVAFLLAGLSALRGAQDSRLQELVTAPRDALVRRATVRRGRVVGQGRRIGSVYRLADGSVVVVRPGGRRARAPRAAGSPAEPRRP